MNFNSCISFGGDSINYHLLPVGNCSVGSITLSSCYLVSTPVKVLENPVLIAFSTSTGSSWILL